MEKLRLAEEKVRAEEEEREDIAREQELGNGLTQLAGKAIRGHKK